MSSITYTRAQLIDALQCEYEYLCHDDYDADVDLPLDEHLAMLQSMSYDDLINDTSTDDEYTLDDFMQRYG